MYPIGTKGCSEGHPCVFWNNSIDIITKAEKENISTDINHPI